MWKPAIDLVGVESAHSAIEVKDSQMKPETPNASHATPYFWREMQMETLQERQIDLSRVRRSRSAAWRPKKGRSARQDIVLEKVYEQAYMTFWARPLRFKDLIDLSFLFLPVILFGDRIR